MSVTQASGRTQCLICSNDVTAGPLGGSVGAGGNNRSPDVKMLQTLLNSLPAGLGGPALLLKEDGICGPKTSAAITGFQRRIMPSPDGRFDPQGKSIKALMTQLIALPNVAGGLLGLAGRAPGTPSVAPSPSEVAQGATNEGKDLLKFVEPKLASLRIKLGHQFDPIMALVNKHFSTGGVKVTPAEVSFLHRVISDIHFQVARAGAFGAMPVDNVVMFDALDTDNLGWTVRGGDKMSINQFQIYHDEGKVIKAPGNTIFLTNQFANAPNRLIKIWTMVHEMAHFVGPRDGNAQQINDNAYGFDGKYLSISKFHKLHNAETISVFFLEAAFGTQAIVKLKDLQQHASYFLTTAPQVAPDGTIG